MCACKAILRRCFIVLQFLPAYFVENVNSEEEGGVVISTFPCKNSHFEDFNVCSDNASAFSTNREIMPCLSIVRAGLSTIQKKVAGVTTVTVRVENLRASAQSREAPELAFGFLHNVPPQNFGTNGILQQLTPSDYHLNYLVIGS